MISYKPASLRINRSLRIKCSRQEGVGRTWSMDHTHGQKKMFINSVKKNEPKEFIIADEKYPKLQLFS